MARWRSKRSRKARLRVIITIGKIVIARMVWDVKIVKYTGRDQPCPWKCFDGECA